MTLFSFTGPCCSHLYLLYSYHGPCFPCPSIPLLFLNCMTLFFFFPYFPCCFLIILSANDGIMHLLKFFLVYIIPCYFLVFPCCCYFLVISLLLLFPCHLPVIAISLFLSLDLSRLLLGFNISPDCNSIAFFGSL